LLDFGQSDEFELSVMIFVEFHFQVSFRLDFHWLLVSGWTQGSAGLGRVSQYCFLSNNYLSVLGSAAKPSNFMQVFLVFPSYLGMNLCLTSFAEFWQIFS
jgi:hypothetical protein